MSFQSEGGAGRRPRGHKYEGDKAEFLEPFRQALYASKIVSYAHGFKIQMICQALISIFPVTLYQDLYEYQVAKH